MDFLTPPTPTFLGDTELEVTPVPSFIPAPSKETRGRKRIVLTDDDYRRAETLTAEGYSRPMVAKALGMSITTLYNRCDVEGEHYDGRLAEALEKGETEDIQLMANSVRQAGLNGNIQAATKYLAAKDPETWGEKNKQTGGGNMTVVVNTGIIRGDGQLEAPTIEVTPSD